MKFKLTKHALEKMDSREITLEQIEQVFDDFTQKSWPNSDGSGTVLLATISPDRELAVVVAGKRPFTLPIKVITTYWFGGEDE